MKYKRALLGYLRLPEPGPVLVGDPWFIGEQSEDMCTWPSAPAGRFPLYADVVDTGSEGGLRIGRVLLVFDEAKLKDAPDRCWKPLGTVGIDTAAVAFLPAAHAAAWRGEEHDAQLRAHWSARTLWPGYGWGEVELEPGGANVLACSSGFGDGTYLVVWWHGPDASAAPHQAIAALGVILLEELTPR